MKSLRINAVGGVLCASDELMEISPTDLVLMLEAKVRPADIGQLRTGLLSSIKLNAFDYSIHGALEGQLAHISAYTLSEPGPNGQTQTFYRVQIKFEPAHSHPKQRLSELKPSMTAGLNILM